MPNDELLDFYYSKRHLIEAITANRDYKRTYFNGNEYTECIPHGEKPITVNVFDDLIFLGTGTVKDIQFDIRS